MGRASYVRIVDVGPRDGLQNEPGLVPVEAKVALIDALGAAGLPAIESGSFVSPKWVPQMADTAAVLARIQRREGVRYPVLTPNLKGLELAITAGVSEVAVFAAASEAFSLKNINCTIAQSLQRFAPVMDLARANGIAVRGYVSCVLGCPYQGAVPVAKVVEVSEALVAMGSYEVSLGDTIGVGTPDKAKAMARAVADQIGTDRTALHFHDTYGQALANVLAGLELGIATVDASVAGLGGCPYAKGASGNLATEDLVYMLDGLGVETGIDLDRLAAAGRAITAALGRAPTSRVAQALAAKAPAATPG
ncbi:hydroxymethylglutaryl-CoA lyase [Xanthobacter agilis]|uniref:hydroxymethylglutaryl-CoA lyase n=1 Tax=Xanthobacter agilis TaxID=47492 RepID=A0ABU0LF08_XANAG|nr:hydroxymethylglutaryl-CoA lyase [Xanthobacter agilis]MDQ0505716.1 hydroxymethylglutaryl-CoA lyase [Xanthobacter agilis]